MFIYIKKNVTDFYVEFPEKLDQEEYNNLGETYEDFLDNKWVLLNDDQIKFHKEYPNASIQDVLTMTIPTVKERTLEEAKSEMLMKINFHDNSEAVNSFTINNAITAWLTVQERTNYKNSVDSAKLLGVDTLSFYIGNIGLSVSTVQAEQMLAAIQLYADMCFIVTKQHKLIVESLTTIDEVDNYDYTVGYPQKLNFTF